MEDLQWEGKEKQISESINYNPIHESHKDLVEMPKENTAPKQDIAQVTSISKQQGKTLIILLIAILVILLGIGSYLTYNAILNYKKEHTGVRGAYNKAVDATNEYLDKIADSYSEIQGKDFKGGSPIHLEKRDANEEKTVDEKLLENILTPPSTRPEDGFEANMQEALEQTKENFNIIKDGISGAINGTGQSNTEKEGE